MIRLFVFLLLVLVVGFGFAWLADRPGDLVLTVAGMQYELTLITAVAALLAIVVAIMVTWWILKSIWDSPRIVNRYFRARKRDRGYQALSTGLLAAGSGDAVTARQMAERAGGFLSSDQEPLIPYLKAQAALLEGRHEEARAIFTEMVEHGETKTLGLHGLYLEAKRVDEAEAASAYAEEAVRLSPQLGWASEASLARKIAEGAWDEALDLVEKRRQSKQLDKDVAKRQRAVVLTAKAMALSAADPTRAKAAATEAVRLAPDLVPASLAGAECAVRLNDVRTATKLLEAIWKTNPHPQVAHAYTHIRAGDSALDRLKRAQRLKTLRPNHTQSLFILAEAEMEAGHYTEARKAVEAVLRQDPTERAWLLLADIEERETGDQGRVRQWLQKAVRAPRDPAWTADGVISEKWAPISPVTGRLDAFEWRIPVSKAATLIEAEGGSGSPDDDRVSEDLLKLVLETPKPASNPAPAEAVRTVEAVAKPEPAKASESTKTPSAEGAAEPKSELKPESKPEPTAKVADAKTADTKTIDAKEQDQPDPEYAVRTAGADAGGSGSGGSGRKSGFRLF